MVLSVIGKNTNDVSGHIRHLVAQPTASLCSFSLHNVNLFLRQVVQFIDKPVDLAVRGLDLALQDGLFVGRSGGGKLLVQSHHGVH